MIQKHQLDAAKYSNLNQKQALEALYNLNYSIDDIQKLKLKPIGELKLVEAIACRRKTEYRNNEREFLNSFYNASLEKQGEMVREIFKDCKLNVDSINQAFFEYTKK